jgi:ABC-2 type transport system permease protein
MNPTALAVRAGLQRGSIEFRQSLTSREDIIWYIVTSIIFLVVLLLQRGSTVEGTTLSLAALTLPSLLGMHIALGGVLGASSVLVIEREDGTLLRSKAVPNGMVAYLVGTVSKTFLGAIASMAAVIVPGVFLIEGLNDAGVVGWTNLLWVLILGSLATLPWGAIIGSLFTNPQAVWGTGMLGLGGLVAISGIFYPIQALWGWVQAIAQVFPIYWLGLGMRSALLPDSAATVEIGNSWRTPETIAVLTAWAVVGLALAPGVLRRMARRESGSSVEARRQKALVRV